MHSPKHLWLWDKRNTETFELTNTDVLFTKSLALTLQHIGFFCQKTDCILFASRCLPVPGARYVITRRIVRMHPVTSFLLGEETKMHSLLIAITGMQRFFHSLSPFFPELNVFSRGLFGRGALTG